MSVMGTLVCTGLQITLSPVMLRAAVGSRNYHDLSQMRKQDQRATVAQSHTARSGRTVILAFWSFPHYHTADP